MAKCVVTEDFKNMEEGSSAALPWFALRVKSRTEKVVATIARNKGFEEFCHFISAAGDGRTGLSQWRCPSFQDTCFVD